MAICALGYLGIRSRQTEDWCRFAGGLIGMQQVDRGGGSTAFRMDDRKQRLVVLDEAGDTLAFMGWEVEHASDLEDYGTRLSATGAPVDWGPKTLADQRHVDRLLVTRDPDGNRIELFHGAAVSSDAFVPGRPISGFRTGPYGMGHAVLHVENAGRLLPFYRDVLDFRVSDYGLTPRPLYFFHVNGRHHSFAMIGTGRRGFHHFMVEYGNLDDVGQGYDLALLEEDGIAYTLGRHTNDYMTSFYATTPSDMFVECGWGGRVIDPETWVPHETHTGPSFWGHERLHMPEEARSHFRHMRMQAAKEGLRAPPVAECPWLYEMLGQGGNRSG